MPHTLPATIGAIALLFFALPADHASGAAAQSAGHCIGGFPVTDRRTETVIQGLKARDQLLGEVRVQYLYRVLRYDEVHTGTPKGAPLTTSRVARTGRVQPHVSYRSCSIWARKGRKMWFQEIAWSSYPPYRDSFRSMTEKKF